MRLKVVVVDLEIPPRARRLALRLGLPAAILAVAAVGWAGVPKTWSEGDKLTAADLNAAFAAIDARVGALESAGYGAQLAQIEQQLGAVPTAPGADCPSGWLKDGAVTEVTVCARGADEIVKVGSGASAFWIDRYEASVWDQPDGSGTQYGATNTGGNLVLDYPPSFPKNGQRGPSFAPLYAISQKNVQPSGSLTWFQAQQACRASGKRLPNGEEWLAAASGTSDPGASDGAGGVCVTQASGPRATGHGAACQSAWGAEDMVGNVWEWTSDWFVGPGTNTTATMSLVPWPDGSYGTDGTWNVASSAGNGTSWAEPGMPAAALRGGAWAFGTSAGVFASDFGSGPTSWRQNYGVRCVTR